MKELNLDIAHEHWHKVEQSNAVNQKERNLT